ncbi:hypothetical protein [Bacteroides sp. 51]|uniref:hypothetical protein n=1 Tax=Bacteroides sp. 51 TaxID=2302938 RepID=UPI0013D8ADB2|nr:hypothetical protein [Bacteroides sp. 51]NDV83908.1 hypothetical protein [Bacteroides sp. 51]
MKTKQQIPPIVRIGAVVLSLTTFAVGFWHSHLGLKEMRPFESDYGSIFIALIILMLLLICYFFAVSGKKIALVFYLACAGFFIVFNLNYFYPSYLGRQLVKEEAIALNDTLHTFTHRINMIDNSGTISNVSKLYTLKDQILDEVKGQAGFGPRAADYLNQFNAITGGQLKKNLVVGSTQEERDQIAKRYSDLLDAEIRNYVVQQVAAGNVSNADKLYTGIQELEVVNENYSLLLKEIIADDSRIPLEAVKTHPQINTMQNLVTSLDDATIKINEASGKEIYPRLKEAKTRNLGRIAHTLSSIWERIGHIDTWAMILLCLFIDLIVPLAVYILIRRKDDDEGEKITLWEQLFGKNRNFNK